jgi:hypothetical protein
MKTLKDIGPEDVSEFQIFDLKGKLRLLSSITDTLELQILLVREWHLTEAIRGKIQAMQDVCDLADSRESLDMEIEE